MLKTKTKLHKAAKGKTRYLVIPANIVTDSQYPLGNGVVVIEIVGDTLVVSNQ